MKHWHHRWSAAMLVVVMSCPALAAPAGETPGKAASETQVTTATEAAAVPPELTAEDLLRQEAEATEQQIRTLIEELQSLNIEAERATGEARAALDLQIQQKVIAALDHFKTLGVNLERQQQAGVNTDEARDRVVSYVVRASNALDQLIDKEVAEFNALRESAESLSGYERVSIENTAAEKLDWIEVLFNKKQEAIFGLDTLGIDSTNHQQNLVNRMTPLAESLSGQLRLIQVELHSINISAGDQAMTAELSTRLRALRTRQTATLNGLSAMVRLMDVNDVNSTDYRKLLLQSGGVNTDIFNPTIMLELLEDEVRKAAANLKKNAGRYVTQLILFLTILLVFKLIASVITRIMRHSFQSRKVEASRLMQEMLLSLSGNGIMILGLLFALSQMGVQITALLAGLGIAGFIIGFALQDSLANFAAGIMILAYRPFDVDDIIEAGGVTGKVSRMSLVSTTILTFDNQTLIVPNNKIWGDVIRNITYQRERRIDMEFSIAYDQDVDLAKQVIGELIAAHELVLDEPGATIQMDKVTPHALVLAIRPWVKRENYWPVRWELLRSIKQVLDDNNIKAPIVSSVVTTPA